jgi:hypothetical protein
VWSRLRENRLALGAAGLAAIAVAWLGLYGTGWNDYEAEAEPAFTALAHGHLLNFLRFVPAYGGSLVERAPFALLPDLWGGGTLAVYRSVAVPCLLAAAALAVWLVAQMRRANVVDARPASPATHSPRRSRQLVGGRAARAIVIAIVVANPLTVVSLEHGHPEEILGGALCVGALLLAVRKHSLWAGIALGLAIANKEWALVAVGPVLVASVTNAAPIETPPGARRVDRLRLSAGRASVLVCLLGTAATAAAVLAPLALVPGGQFASAARAVASTPSNIFSPQSVWWFFGHHSPGARGPFGTVGAGFRVAPAWVGPLSHPAVVLGAALLSALWWARRRSSRTRAQTLSGAHVAAGRAPTTGAWPTNELALLALALLARCLLDTWDNGYYPEPFLLALCAWEALSDPVHPPILTILSCVLVWASFEWVPNLLSPDGQSVFFLAWTLPLAGLLAARVYAPDTVAAAMRAIARRLGGRTLWDSPARPLTAGAPEPRG